ncbi:unnamed protein product [Adineta steineri]|uniref:RRM domain-containing protein n=1 Tax=Adineta steineri TaxID=433720 RepID=A0A813QSB9_9BILA|nr:unnamed protein product [Adineta steineri]
MSIFDLRILARLIHPKNIISLTLSNEQQTVHQIQYFLHDFRIDQFSQLRSLTLIGTHDDNLDPFQKYIMGSSLITLSISFGSCSLQSVDKLLLAISSCKLKNLIMLGVCRWDLVYFIVSNLSHLRKLFLKNLRKERFVDDTIAMPDIIQYSNLTSLSLDVLYGIEMDYVESILILCHGLQYLRVLAPYMELIFHYANVTAKHLFRNVTDLTLIINQQWPIDSIEYLSTIVNLSNLDKIYLNFQCKCDFVRSLDAEMKVLFKRAWSLRSLQIIFRNRTAINWITGSAVGLKQNLDISSGHSRNPVSLYVSGFAVKCRYEDLQEIFGRYGRIVDISVPFNDHKRDFKEAALDALDCCRLFGREITVKFAWSDRKTSLEMDTRKKETRYKRGDYEDSTGRHNRSRSRSRHRRSTSSEISDHCTNNQSPSAYSHLPVSRRRTNHSRSKYGSPKYGKQDAAGNGNAYH